MEELQEKGKETVPPVRGQDRFIRTYLPILLVVLFVIITVYIFINVEYIKSDPCLYCMEKMGQVCYPKIIHGGLMP